MNSIGIAKGIIEIKEACTEQEKHTLQHTVANAVFEDIIKIANDEKMQLAYSNTLEDIFIIWEGYKMDEANLEEQIIAIYLFNEILEKGRDFELYPTQKAKDVFWNEYTQDFKQALCLPYWLLAEARNYTETDIIEMIEHDLLTYNQIGWAAIKAFPKLQELEGKEPGKEEPLPKLPDSLKVRIEEEERTRAAFEAATKVQIRNGKAFLMERTQEGYKWNGTQVLLAMFCALLVSPTNHFRPDTIEATKNGYKLNPGRYPSNDLNKYFKQNLGNARRQHYKRQLSKDTSHKLAYMPDDFILLERIYTDIINPQK